MLIYSIYKSDQFEWVSKIKNWNQPKKTIRKPDTVCLPKMSPFVSETCDPCGFEYRKLLKEIDDTDESYWI